MSFLFIEKTYMRRNDVEIALPLEELAWIVSGCWLLVFVTGDRFQIADDRFTERIPPFSKNLYVKGVYRPYSITTAVP